RSFRSKLIVVATSILVFFFRLMRDSESAAHVRSGGINGTHRPAADVAAMHRDDLGRAVHRRATPNRQRDAAGIVMSRHVVPRPQRGRPRQRGADLAIEVQGAVETAPLVPAWPEHADTAVMADGHEQ